MPAVLTRSETKHAVYETTTCCAYREYPKYVLPEGESDDIQIPDIKLRAPNLGLRSCATDLGLSTCWSTRCPAQTYSWERYLA